MSIITPESREFQEAPHKCIVLSPWTVLGIVHECINTAFIIADPAKLGYTFKFAPDPQKAACVQNGTPLKDVQPLYIALGNTIDPQKADKLPAVYIHRGEVSTTSPTFRQAQTLDPAESLRGTFFIDSLPIQVTVIAPKAVAEVEQLADFIRCYLQDFTQELQYDFNFMKLRVVGMSPPFQVKGASPTYAINITLQVVYNRNTVVTGDHLKIKTVSARIYDALTETQFNA